MEHVVFFPAQDGTPAFRRFAGLEDAVRFVEHLRNVENVAGASVYSLTEVPLAFKAWYRVEIPTSADQESSAPEAPAVVDVGSEPHVPATVAETIETYTNGGLSSVSLPDAGSGTGIVVPNQPLVAVDQFTAPPVAIVPPAPAPFADAPVAAASATPEIESQQGQLLEPAFGARRERGLGFFAH